MNRIRSLEYSWILSAAFTVNAYTAKHTNGKTYVIYAHDFNDMSWFFSKLECLDGGLATYQNDWILSYVPDKNGNPKKRPFWYRGRVYEL